MQARAVACQPRALAASGLPARLASPWRHTPLPVHGGARLRSLNRRQPGVMAEGGGGGRGGAGGAGGGSKGTEAKGVLDSVRLRLQLTLLGQLLVR